MCEKEIVTFSRSASIRYAHQKGLCKCCLLVISPHFIVFWLGSAVCEVLSRWCNSSAFLLSQRQMEPHAVQHSFSNLKTQSPKCQCYFRPTVYTIHCNADMQSLWTAEEGNAMTKARLPCIPIIFLLAVYKGVVLISTQVVPQQQQKILQRNL